MLLGILGVGIEDILYVGLAVRNIESLDIRHGGEEADDGFVGFEVGHGL